MPPEFPPLPAKPVAEGLIDCSLDKRGFTITYDELLQGHIIEISARAGASSENVQCIWDAAWPEFVQFEDRELQSAYDELTRARFEPLAQKSARDYLGQRGLLKGLPGRDDFSSLEDFAVAIEKHCGFTGPQVFRVEGDTILFSPEPGTVDPSSYDKSACFFAALLLSGETKFGFIGNELSAPSD